MKIFNNCLCEGKFPDILKYSEITPVFGKRESTQKREFKVNMTDGTLRIEAGS